MATRSASPPAATTAGCTNCQVNWKERKLKLVVVQLCGQPRPWNAELAKAEEQFFKATVGEGDDYVGRMK